MKTVLLGMALALGLGTTAQAQDFQPTRQLDHFTRSALKSTLEELGATYRERDDRPNITIEFDNSLKADALLMACDDQDTSTNCLGSSFLATFERPSGASDADIADAITEYNYRKNFGRAYVAPDGEITLRMYIIADGKITMENYRQQIGLWVYSAGDFASYLYE